MLPLDLVILLAHALVAFSLYGTVRASDSGEPIPAAVVEVLEGGQSTRADSAGRYVLEGLPAGAHMLGVSRLGYEARTLEVFVGQDSAMRVDISLTPRPVVLSRIMVVAPTREAPGDTSLRAPAREAEIGSSRFAGDALHANPAFGDADVLGTLAASPSVSATGDSPTALRVRGGSGDQNLILLDGVPLYNAYHAAGTLGALNPDAVSSVTLHAGVPSAAFGGALSSVIAIESEDPAPDRVTSRGALGLLSLRQMITGPLPGAAGTFLLSGRRSTRDLFGGGSDPTNSTAAFGDLFAKGTLRLPHGDLEFFSFSSADRLAFDASVETTSIGSAIAGAGPAGNAPASTANGVLQNAFAWSTGTQALVWRSDRDAATRLGARAWRTRFDADADWAAATGPLRLASALSDMGVSGDVSWHLSSTLATAGVTAERVHTEFDLRLITATGADTTLPGLPTLSSSPLLLAVFFEDQWHPDKQWTLTAGVRDQLASDAGRALEPRLSLRFAPTARLSFAAGYARNHQYVQSLRNEESLLDAVVGIGLPVAAGTAGIPIARSDQGTLSTEVRFGRKTALVLDAYVRRLEGLLLVAPVTAQPFATERFARGSGRASGAALLIEHRGDRVFGHVAYAFGSTTREAEGQRYRLSFAGTQSLTVAVGYQARSRTALRAAFWATTGRPTSVVDGNFAWTPHNLLGGTDEISGSPQRISGALNGHRLSPYARLDLGLRQEWRANLFGRSAGLTGLLTVSNVLGRANALGATLSSDGRTRTIPMLPRSVMLSLAWAY